MDATGAPRGLYTLTATPLTQSREHQGRTDAKRTGKTPWILEVEMVYRICGEPREQ